MQTIKSTFIDKTVLIHVKDGRAFKGTFVCVDDSKNVILANSEELKMLDDDDSTSFFPSLGSKDRPIDLEVDKNEKSALQLQQRWVGMVMVAGKDIEKLEIQTGLPPSPSIESKKPLVAPPGWPSDPSLYM